MNRGTRAAIDRSAINAVSFMNKISKDSSTDCWIWTASKNAKGYGQFAVRCKVFSAHRVSYVLHYGSQPNIVMHSCDQPSCVNPHHLQDGSTVSNYIDAVNKGRRPRPKGTRTIFETIETVLRDTNALGQSERHMGPFPGESPAGANAAKSSQRQ